MDRNSLIVKLLCVALVASIMMPAGRVLFPYVAGMIGSMQYEAAEAVVSATIGFGLYAAIFG
jgi:hypothetical protein